MRSGAVAARVAVIAVWGLALFALTRADESGLAYALGGTVLTLALGLAAGRWWVVWAPWVVFVVLLAVIASPLGACNSDSCADGNERLLLVFLALAVFAVPATAVLAFGVAVRRVGLSAAPSPAPPGPRHSPPPAPPAP